MGMGDGLIRFSVGLDNDIQQTWGTIKRLLEEEDIGAEPGAVDNTAAAAHAAQHG